MYETLADIEALSLRCKSSQSKSYISEAILCYRSGAYRAAIVSTWIALVFDLIDKVRELALSGDAAAKVLETQHENYITQIEQNNPVGFKGALEFERGILETCKNQLQFFDPQQFIDLQRLREDRHRCAHPSFLQVGLPYTPSAEQARLHIRNVILHVLAQPPVQGKAALARLKALISSTYFPMNTPQAITQLQSNGFIHPTDGLIKGLLDLLIFGFVTNGDALYGQNKALVAIEAIYSLEPAISEERMKLQINKVIKDVPDPDLDKAATLVAATSYAGDILEQPSKDKLTQFIEIGLPLSAVLSLATNSYFLTAVQTRVDDLTRDDLLALISSVGPNKILINCALTALSRAANWYEANAIFSGGIMPLFQLLSADDAKRIIRMPDETGADLHGSNGMRVFLDHLRQSCSIPEAELDALLIQHRYMANPDRADD